jgi:transcriptional regulator with XRE-family HTH domain
LAEHLIYDFGYRLRELRKNRNLTQKAVADRLNMHPNTIRGYENNTLTPSVESLIELAVLYNSSVDYILGLTKRSNVYVDDCTPEQQAMILDIVKTVKAHLTGD